MARVSVFTPSHDTRYLTELYDSLAHQTFADWEWVVLLNGRAQRWSPPQPDARVRVLRAAPGVRGVGALKREACEQATGELLVEADHDDLLTPRCLEQVVAAFDAHPDAVLVYSDFAQVEADGSPNSDRFNTDMGWVYSPETVDGTTYDRCHAMRPTPHNLAYIWYQPNHVRAFRREAYDAVGGYDATRAVLDDQELMVRLFALGDAHHVDELLYLQRVHGKNTQSDPRTNADIQVQTVEIYRDSIAGLAHAWAQRRGLASVRLRTPVWFGADDEPGFTDHVLGTAASLPYQDNQVGVLLAPDVLQKVTDRAAFFNECYRVLAPHGLLLTLTPSTDGRGAFQDPSHLSFWNENSFMYVTQAGLSATLPGLTARFQVSYLGTHFPSPSHEAMQISYVQANLIAVKDDVRNGGPLLC